MSTQDDDDTNPGTPGAPDLGAAPPLPFFDRPWHVLIGLLSTSNPEKPGDLSTGMELDIVMTEAAMVQTKEGLRPDNTIEAVHFARWFDRNRPALMSIWRAEYNLYINLRLATQRRLASAAGNDGRAVVGADGKPLQ